MSQQINLLLPELRTRFDWLGLPAVAGAALIGLLLLVVLASLAALRTDSLQAREVALKAQLAALQQQVQSLGQSLGARQGEAGLGKKIEAARLAVTQRQEVLSLIAQGDLSAGHGYSSLLQGFSRQVQEGVWLVGFGLAEKDIQIRGRLLDPALLSTYINRLNAEPAFAGRRFAALDMKGVDPALEKPPEGQTDASRPRSKVRYTEFVLHTELEKRQ